jgi:hypothetical protein
LSANWYGKVCWPSVKIGRMMNLGMKEPSQAVRLANALMNKRITRAKADLYVAELLQRADHINAILIYSIV